MCLLPHVTNYFREKSLSCLQCINPRIGVGIAGTSVTLILIYFLLSSFYINVQIDNIIINSFEVV
jgi:hypothetical protein